MNEQYQQFLAWLQQQNGGGGFNIPTNTPNNSQMQGFTQNLWNSQPTFNPANTPYTSTQTDPMMGMSSAQGININPLNDVPIVDNSSVFYNPEQLNRMRQNNASTASYDAEGNPITTPVQQQPNNQFNFSSLFNPVSTENATFQLGQSLAFNNNNPYASDKAKSFNTAKGIAAGAKTLSSLLRTGFAGAAYQNKQNQAVTSYYNQQNQQDFAPIGRNGGQFENGGRAAFNPALANNQGFQDWYSQNTVEGQNNIPYSPNGDYDYLSYYMNGQNLTNKSGNHFPDTYKRPKHETFSNESIYSTPENPGGFWQGEQYSPNGKFQYEDGGQVTQEQFLTGSYIGNQPNKTAEIENGEYVQHPEGLVQKAQGATHEQGGIPVDFKGGERVISDNLKLGGKNARQLKKEFDIDVKANHTFAEAIDKYKNKIGLTKLDKEQEGIFKKLEDKTGIEDDQTNAINEAYLAKQIQETEVAKTPLNEQLSSFTDIVFQKQEELKGNTTELQFENGGAYTSKLITLSCRYV